MCRLKRRISLLFYSLLFISFATNAQEAPATQQYAQRLFTNPAYAGLLSEYSVTAGHRSQWTGTDGGFSTQWLSGEYQFKERKTSAGITISSDRTSAGAYNRTQAGAMYAYHTKLKPKLDFSAGLQVSYASQRGGYSHLIFEDQLGPDGSVQQPTSENTQFNRSAYLTFSSGVVIFTDQFWLGLSAQHLNNPVVDEASNSKLPALFHLQTGYRFYARSYFAKDHFEEISFIPTLAYTQQKTFKKVDAIFYSVISPFTIGVGYTWLPGTSNTSSNNAFTALAGITYKSFKLGYSYRQPLGNTYVALGSGHEISISFQMVDYRKIYRKLGTNKNYNRIACPEI